MLFTKLAVRLGESGERFSSFCQSSISYFPAFVKRLLQFLSDFFARPVLFFEKKSRQKKLQLSGTIYRFFRLPCVKGFASMRSMLAVLAERGCKKQSLSRLAPTAPFTQRSRKTRHFNHLAAPPHLFSSLLSLISAKRLF